MFRIYTFKKWFEWHLIGAHVCTAAVAVGFVGTWRLPREAFRHGGLVTLVLFTLALVVVSASSALLQLAVGQLSQQDVAGVWRAVPFFSGVGYLRLLANFLYSICTIIYVALCLTYFFYTIGNSLLLWECTDNTGILDGNDTYTYNNASACINATLLAPVAVDEEPEYYVPKAFIIIVLWLLFPLIFYSPVKVMKRLFYAFGPAVVILGVVIILCVGESKGLSNLRSNEWASLKQPFLWHSVITQALLAGHVAGGYLIAAGDTVYANTDVERTTLSFVGANVVSGWMGVIFWYSMSSSSDKDTSTVAVLVETLILSIDKRLNIVWPLLIFAMLFFSGAITMLTLLYPIYERMRRITCVKWRYAAVASSVVGAAASLAVLAFGNAVTLLEEVVVPFLITVATSIEITAFVFIYGWKVLSEDVEFLMERKLGKWWVVGWCTAPGIVASFTIWWTVTWLLRETDWSRPPWVAGGFVTIISVTLLTIVVFAAISVAKQVQYDIISKLKSSFRPSRHWGPRDPITHYYWLTRREESTRLPRSRYRRIKLGQLSGNSSFFNASNTSIDTSVTDKKRANSDDLLFYQRKQKIAGENVVSVNRRRSKSLDWAVMSKVKIKHRGYVKHKNREAVTQTTRTPTAANEREDDNNFVLIKKGPVVDNNVNELAHRLA